MILSILQAATSGSDGSLSDPFTYLTGLGFPGVVIGLFVTGQLRTKGEVERMAQDLMNKDQLIAVKDKQIEALQAGIVDKAIPALTRSTQILEQIPLQNSQVLEQLGNAHRDTAELVSRIERLRREEK